MRVLCFVFSVRLCQYFVYVRAFQIQSGLEKLGPNHRVCSVDTIEDSFLHSIQLSMRYIQCTVVPAFRGRSKIALLLLRVAHAVLPS